MLRLFTLIILLTLTTVNLNAQPRYTQDDVITYSDSRQVRNVEIGDRVVYVATNGGIWRFSRFTGEPLQPWHMGVGLNRAISLSGGRLLLWHNSTGTLWLTKKSGKLLFYRSSTENWQEASGFLNGNITSIGESAVGIVVETSAQEQLTVLNPQSGTISGIVAQEPAGTRWKGRRAALTRNFRNYDIVDGNYFFERNGRIIDEYHREFYPADVALNDWNSLLYICYPGLGLAVADERMFRIEILQLGPSGSDVQAIAIDSGNKIWIGGNNSGIRHGLTKFDRQTFRWTEFRERFVPDLDSHIAWDVEIVGRDVFFATNSGLVRYRKPEGSWKTFDEFDGLSGIPLRAVELVGDKLIAGGDRGLSYLQLPDQVFSSSGEEMTADMIVADMTSDRDTLWSANLQGLFRWSSHSGWQTVSGDQVIGDEPARSVAIDRKYLSVGGPEGIREMNRENGEWISHYSEVFLRGGKPLSLVSNDSLLWIGTDRGLFRRNRLRGRWLTYGVKQGLPHERIQRLVLESDTLWIGTPAGLTRFLWNRPERDGE